MRILMVTQWFDPEPSFKGLVFARALAERGHEVRAITGFPNYPGGKLYRGYRIRPWQRELMNGIPVMRVPLFPSHDRSVIRRIATYASFALSASTIGAMAARPADVIYAFWPPPTVGLPTAVLSAVTGAPVVLDVEDLWPESVAASGMLGNRMALAVLGKWCDWVYRRASGISVLSEGFRLKLLEKGVPESKIRVIYNWCDESAGAARGTDRDLARRLGLPAGKFLVMFAGTLGL